MRRGLRLFTLLVLKLWRPCLRHPRAFTAAVLAAIAFFALQLPKLTAELRVYDIVDPNFHSTEQLREMKSEFGDTNSVLLLFANVDGTALRGEQACRIRDWLAGLREGGTPLSDEISGWVNPFRLKKASLVRDRVEFPALLPEPRCDARPYDLKPLLDSPWGGVVTDPKGRDLAAQIDFRDTVGRSRYGKFDPAPIGALWARLQRELLPSVPGVKAYLGGRSSFQWHYQQALKRDSLINVAVLVLMILFFRVVYGTWRSGLIILGLVLATAVVVFGAMSLAGSPVDFLSNSLFLLMGIAAVEDFIFISHEQLTHARAAWRPSVRSLLMPGFFTSLTTFVGFFSLETADMAIIRRFGFWAGSAALCEWGMIFFVLPAALKAAGASRGWVAPGRARLGGAVSRLARVRLPGALVRVSLGLFALSLFGFAHLEINDSPRANFVKSHLQRRTYDYLRASRGWEGPIYVVFPDEHRQDANEAALARMSRDPNVARIEDPYAVRAYFLREFDEEYRRLVRSQLAVSKTYRGSFSPLDTARATLYLRSLDLADLNGSIARVTAACREAGCYAAGEGVVYAAYSDRVVGTLLKSFGSSLLLVGLIVLGLASALGAGNRPGLMFSVLWAPVLIVGGLAVFRVPMNLTNSMFASVLVGLTGDNAVQYLFASRRGGLAAGIRRRGGASVQVTAIAAGASLLFLGLTLVPLKILGLLLSLGFVIALAGDLWVLNALTEPRSSGAS